MPGKSISQPIPLLELRRQYQTIRKEINKAINGVLTSGQFILGENVSRFEEEFAHYCGVKFGLGVASGTDALMLACKSLQIRPSKEVITVSFTFASSVDCIIRNDLKPVFVDVSPETYTMDVSQLEKAISRKTRAILLVHLYGQPADLKPIVEIAEDKGIWLIEDCAQAHGAEYEGRKVGSFGDISCFSFYPSKNLGAYGDGGAILTSDESLFKRVKMLREYGQRKKYQHEILGFNSRLDEIQAAILRVKLKHLDSWNDRRRANAGRYNAILSDLEQDGHIVLPRERPRTRHVYHIYAIQVDRRRNSLIRHLYTNHICTGIHYPFPLHKQAPYLALWRKANLEVTERLARRVLSLPMFPELSPEEISLTCGKLKTFYGRD
jgi:dTDP-4-amino-4,6-dideoxygalactose transaminase